jgi:hypothetical protein
MKLEVILKELIKENEKLKKENEKLKAELDEAIKPEFLEEAVQERLDAPFTYNSGTKILLVPMIPQPKWDQTIEKKIRWGKGPLKPGDVIKGHKVLAVLGVEERTTTDDLEPPYRGRSAWHFKYLITKGEG